jgi:hypothetical protein
MQENRTFKGFGKPPKKKKKLLWWQVRDKQGSLGRRLFKELMNEGKDSRGAS